MEPSKIAHGLNALSCPEDEDNFGGLSCRLRPSRPLRLHLELCRARFGIFERFPDHDDYGTLWSILHLLD